MNAHYINTMVSALTERHNKIIIVLEHRKSPDDITGEKNNAIYLLVYRDFYEA